MTSSTSQCWFVPLDHLLQQGGAFLRRADAPLATTDQPIQSGSPFTISLETFHISKKLDRRVGGNDLLVRSWTAYGDQPPVEIVHFFRKNVGENFIGENLAVEHMFAAQSYSDTTIRINVEILEVDGDSSIERELKIAASFLGAVFPAVLPFTSIATSLYENLKGLFDNPHDLAFSGSLELNSSNGRDLELGQIPFRSGAYILLGDAIEGNLYKLRDFRLEPAVANQSSTALDYVVIKIVPKVINSLNPDDLLTNQNLATALLQEHEVPELLLPKPILKRAETAYNSIKVLQNITQKAKLLDELAEYHKLRTIQSAESNSQESLKVRLDREERLKKIAANLRQYFE
jgi:hypothetical protein